MAENKKEGNNSSASRASRHGKRTGEPDDNTKPGRPTGIPSPTSPHVKPKPNLEDIIATIGTLSETVKSGFEEQKISNKDIADKLSDSVKKWDAVTVKVAAFEEVSDKTQRRLKAQELRIHSMEIKLEEQIRDGRRKYMLVEGVPESKNEVTEEIIAELFDCLQVGFSTERCDRVQRRGKPIAPQGRAAKPRPIIISFIRVNDKSAIFKGLKNLRDQEKWKGVSIGDDLTDTQRNQVRDMLALSAYARSKGYNSTVKGNLLLFEGTKYKFEELDQLPIDITLSKAKTIEVDGGKGLAFQSHHSPLSNMYACHVTYEGRHFGSVEVAYQYARARICGYNREAELIAESNYSYKAKSISYGFKDTKEWLNCRVKVMTDLLRFKFQNNDACKQRLVESKGKKLYEATHDKFWATGLVLSRARDIKEAKFPGQNKLGEILEKVREEVSKL